MPTSAADLDAAASQLDGVADALRAFAGNMPGPCPPCPPCPECPPQFPTTSAASLAEVRDLFGHGGTYDSRPGWAAAMGRPSVTRSLWAAGASEDAHVTWWHNLVDDVKTDDGKTVYVVGFNPWPGQTTPPLSPPGTYYQRVGAELARLDRAQQRRVWVRFGWEPDGDWYTWSWRPKGQPFNENRYAAYVKGWKAFDGALAGTIVGLTLSLIAEADQAQAERAIRDLSPDAFTMDIYATYVMRSVAKWVERLTWQVEMAERYDLPWGVDETSPYVDKVKGTTQVGVLDSRLSVELLHALVWFVQVQAGAGRPPLWVQFFERNPVEGKFSMVSVAAPSSAATQYRTASGPFRYTTAPRTAQALVSLLGTPS